MEVVLAARGGERGLRAVPSHKNGCEHAEEVLSHGVEEAEVLCQKIVDRLIQELEKVGLHGLGSFGTGISKCYGMRQFCTELGNVPVTGAMVPLRLERAVVSALMALVVASRCCLP